MKRVLLVIILVLGTIPHAYAAQLDASILFGDEVTNPSFEFLRIVYIEYPNGGEISETLRGENQTLAFDADSSTPEMKKLVEQINSNLKTIPSNAIATDVKIKYQVSLKGNQNNAVIEYKIQLSPTITNHVFKQESEKSTVDASWRGIAISEPIIIQTEYGSFDINNPRSALDVMIPDVAEKLKDISILELPLVDASGIKKLPLNRWHSLFDNTAILPGAIEYKYTGKNVITHYSMGECTIIIGTCEDRKWIADVELDKKYTIKIIESRDDATIALEGYVQSAQIGDLEVFQTSLRTSQPEISDGDEFLSTALYGMTGMAVVAAVAMFVISNQKLKRDKNEGQTGVDPAHLRSYDTSESSGSYKTNRGESYLISDNKSKMPV